MITDLKPYPKMKDSGVEWLGEVPEHWEVLRTKRTFGRIVGASTPSSGETDYWDGDVVRMTPADILALEKETEGLLGEIIGITKGDYTWREQI